MDSNFRLHTKQYYKVVKAREDRGLNVDPTYKRMVDNAVLIKSNPEIFSPKVKIVGMVSKINFLL